MRAFAGLASVLGRLMLLAAMVVLLLSLVTRRTVDAIYDPALMQTAVARYWLNDEALVRLGQRYAQAQMQKTPSDDERLIFWRALNTFDDDQWRTMTGMIAPRDVVLPMVDEAALALTTWLRTPGAPPEAVVSLASWKAMAQRQSPVWTDWFFAQFRPCDAVETLVWGEAWALDDWRLPPLCLPLGGARQIFVESASAALQQEIANVPAQVNLLDPQRVPIETLETAKNRLAQARRWAGLAWVLVDGLLLLGLVLIVRSWGDLFSALGSFMAWSGLALVLLGVIPRRLAAWAMQFVSGIPAWASDATQATAAFYLEHILLPLRPLGIGLAVAGAAAWLAAALLKARQRKAENHAAG